MKFLSFRVPRLARLLFGFPPIVIGDSQYVTAMLIRGTIIVVDEIKCIHEHKGLGVCLQRELKKLL
jgi:hypothetical protein